MKGIVGGLGIVALVAVLGWLVAFGAAAPCDALQAEARNLSGDKKDVTATAILDAAKSGTLSQVECAATAVRIKAFGKGGVTVVAPGGKK